MQAQLAFILRHGYFVLFALNLGEQLGLPLPAGTALLAAGSLAKAGKLSALPVVGLAVLGTLIGHGAWFFAGRLGGNAVLRFVCKVSLEPDSCVRRTNDLFARHGNKSLLVAPFIPGFATVAPPLAGTSGMTLPRFLLLDGLGAALWAGSLVAVGYFLGPALETVLLHAIAVGPPLIALAGLAFASWIGFKVYQRRALAGALQVTRISPDELQRLRDQGEPHTVVDLRHERELSLEPVQIPGAIRIGADELSQRWEELPRGQPIVLYCN
jgi:membrane protein DedA with SNARE-associated domain